jgi:hypothetical protein
LERLELLCRVGDWSRKLVISISAYLALSQSKWSFSGFLVRYAKSQKTLENTANTVISCGLQIHQKHASISLAARRSGVQVPYPPFLVALRPKIEQESIGTGEQVKDKAEEKQPIGLLACGLLFT